MKKWCFLFCFIPFLLQAKDKSATYLRTLNKIDASTKFRSFPANDMGWFIFSIDSAKLYKFNACGQSEWYLKYSLPNLYSYAVDILKKTDGGFGILMRVSGANGYYPVVINTDASGNVIWCKSFADVVYSEVAYTLMQDNNNNYFLYGNLENISNNTVFNSLTKINSSGNVVWSKLYNHGGIWGGAIRTQDQGFLLRTGSILIKTDAAGNEIWTSSIQAATYQYHKPVEVADGYILNGYNHGSGLGNDTVCFFKVDKNGNLAWGGKKQVDFVGEPQELFSKYNGNFLFFHSKPNNGITYSTATEFDKELNVVNQTAIGNPSFNTSFYQNAICFLSDSSAIIAGKMTSNYPVVIPHTGFIKANFNQHFNCDTNIQTNIQLRQVTQQIIPTSMSSRSYTSIDQFIITEQGNDSGYFVCTTFQPLQLELGADTNMCEGSSLVLKNKYAEDFDQFLWSNGSTANEINVSQAGTYWLKAINSCRRESVTDTIRVHFSNFPKPLQLRDTSICSLEPIVLNASITGGTYLWMDGSSLASYPVTAPGSYSVDISYLNCTKHFETQVSDCESLIMPNVITPNNDGLNNAFLPIEMRGIITTNLKIFNRWGQEIYATTDILNRPWKGRTYSEDCPEGVYYWTLEYSNYQKEIKLQKGTVTLLRN